jgi:hypothetical protein
LNHALARIVAPHFVAGVLIDSRGVVVFAAPIVHWMLDNPYDLVERMCSRRNWTIDVIAI